MGAITEKLKSSYKAPKTLKAQRGGRKPPDFGPKGNRGSGRGIASNFWMARAMLKDMDVRERGQTLGRAQVFKTESRLRNAGDIGDMLDQLNMQADQALAAIKEED